MQRRNFLKKISIASALLSVPPVLGEAMAAPGGKKEIGILTLRGKVSCNGAGVAGVPVTDGITITVTDARGNYSLQSSKATEFVYISIPSGYHFSNEKGIAKFYVPVTTSGSSFTADFKLDKLTVDDNSHCFVVWADTQMISEEDVQLLKKQTVPDLQQLVAAHPSQTLFHGIGCGDLVWDKFELFKGYREAVAATGVTFFNVIGNHDMDIDARSDELSARTFKQQFGPTYYSFNRGKIHYVVLDDVFFVGGGKQYIGYITESQLQWLEQDLALLQPGATVVVSLHIPTNTGAAKREKKDAELSAVVANRQQLYKILKPFNVHFMSGHTHFNDTWEHNNMMEHNHGTVCGAWWTGPICGDGTPNGYGVYEVNGNDISWYYKGTGLSKQTQLRLYGRGRSKEYPEAIVANVWNWDAKWKVEWLEDGVNKGPMQRRVGLDPLAVELYAGPNLPAKHTFAEPMLTDHIFYATPSAAAKKIEVRATDRFGNSYTESITIN